MIRSMRFPVFASILTTFAAGCSDPPSDRLVTTGAAITSPFDFGGQKTIMTVPATPATTSVLGVTNWVYAVFSAGLLIEGRNANDAPISRLSVGVRSSDGFAVLEWQGNGDDGLFTVAADKSVRETSLPLGARAWTERATADLKVANLAGLAYSGWCRLAALQDALSAAGTCAGGSKASACTDVAAGAVLGAASNVDATCKVSRFANHALDAGFQGVSLVVTDRVTTTKHTYPNLVRWGCNAKISHKANLNGIPGDEVLVEEICGDTVTFHAVDDLNQRLYQWNVPAGVYLGFALGDTDTDHPGKEIVALVNPAMGQFSTLYSTKLDPDSPYARLQQTTVPGDQAKILGVDNLEGGAADGIAIGSMSAVYGYRDAGGGPYSFRNFPLATPFNATYGPIDTDGNAGKEAIVKYASGGIVILDFAQGRMRAYPTATGLMGTNFKDKDGIQGVEICAQDSGNRWGLLVDRTGHFNVAAAGECP
jgi:hypothetical protein